MHISFAHRLKLNRQLTAIPGYISGLLDTQAARVLNHALYEKGIRCENVTRNPASH